MDLQEVLEQHKLWLNGQNTGKQVNLRSADLSGANLSGADLRSADLSGADLCSADLSGANLRSADLSGADLCSADLSGANLSGADLRSANLRSANLSGANLSGANLSGADLSGASLATRYICFSQIGSRHDQTTYSFVEDKVWCGCFIGTLEEFAVRVAETHALGTQARKEYDLAIVMIRALAE